MRRPVRAASGTTVRYCEGVGYGQGMILTWILYAYIHKVLFSQQERLIHITIIVEIVLVNNFTFVDLG